MACVKRRIQAFDVSGVKDAATLSLLQHMVCGPIGANSVERLTQTKFASGFTFYQVVKPAPRLSGVLPPRLVPGCYLSSKMIA